MKTQNWLSIDLDILMIDCLNTQEFIDEDLTPLQSWQVIQWKTKKNFFPACNDTLNKIKDILKLKCKSAQSYIINEHDEIVELLELNNAHRADMTNLDFHSDITYGNDDRFLNIENWVQHARKKDLIHNYLWINRDDSEVITTSPFNYNRCCWKDININALPEYDHVVFCISRHFTFPAHWHFAQDLREYLCNEIQNDFVVCPAPKNFNEDDYPEFAGEEMDIEVKESWYRLNGFYIQAQLIEDILWLSFVNVSNKKINILSPCQRILRKFSKNYKIGMRWKSGYRSEKIIQRLIKSHNVISESLLDDFKEIIINDMEV